MKAAVRLGTFALFPALALVAIGPPVAATATTHTTIAVGVHGNMRAETFSSDGDAIYADFVQAIGVLRSDPKVQGGNIGAVGFSNGGYFAVWLALTAKVQAAVSYYGAYTGAGGDLSETRFRRLASATASPILILHGLDDQTVPVAAARRLTGILSGAHAPYEMQRYPDAGHAFDRGGLLPPIVGAHAREFRVAEPGNDPGNKAASVDAWARTLAFLQKCLSPGTASPQP